MRPVKRAIAIDVVLSASTPVTSPPHLFALPKPVHRLLPIPLNHLALLPDSLL